ncbi:MAG TPA: proline dehydrogenase family protein [Bacteroidia bacterium]
MPKIDFNNTEIAFSHKTDRELKKARLLFKSFGYPWLINYGPILAAKFINVLPPLKSLIKNTLFAQFCGGESIQDCKKAISSLSNGHIGTILDYSVEGEENDKVFDYTADEIIRTIEVAATNKEGIPFSVFKTTGIGRMDLLTKVNAGQQLDQNESAEFERVKARFEKICLKAYQSDVRLFVDAEDSWIQDIIDQLTYEAMLKYNQQKAIIYNTIQCYRTGRVEHIQSKLKEMNVYLGFKLVRGAYMEKERERATQMGYVSPIHLNKADTDNEYDQAVKLCMDQIERVSICAGTHNELSSMKLAALMEERSIPLNHPHVYFAQLLGMSDHISYNLAKGGYNVAKYVPYGPVKAVLPYLSRRARENSSVKGQVGRELGLIQTELLRRRANSK